MSAPDSGGRALGATAVAFTAVGALCAASYYAGKAAGVRWEKQSRASRRAAAKAEAGDAAVRARSNGKAGSDVKMVLCVRTDLKMQKGKIAAQCGHATLGMYKKAVENDAPLVDRWEERGQAKVALKVAGEDELKELKRAARAIGLLTHVVVDAGRTQIAPNSRTVLAILGEVELVNSVTGDLSLL